MNKTPIYRDPPTLRSYEDFKVGVAYTKGWNDAMDAIFPEEAKKRWIERMKKRLSVVQKE